MIAPMQPRSFLRFPLFAAALLCLSVTAAHLQAQGFQTFAESSSAPAGIVSNITASRTYSGTVTQVTAAGQLVQGTFMLSVFKTGGVSASTSLAGVDTIYSGLLSPTTFYSQGQHTGFLVAQAAGGFVEVKPTAPGAVVVPFVFNKTEAFGGVQQADGTLLTFRAARVAK